MDPVVLPVRHKEAVVGRNPDTMRQSELSGTRPRLTPRLDKPSVGCETVHTGIAVPITDVNLSVGRNGYIGRPVS